MCIIFYRPLWMRMYKIELLYVYYLIKEHTTKRFPTSIYFKSTDLWFMDDPYSLKGSGKSSNS